MRQIGRSLKLIPVLIFILCADQNTHGASQHGQNLIDEPLKDLSYEFAAGFIRIHRNALVAEKYIDGVERDTEGQYSVRLRDSDTVLPVSRRHASELLRRVRG